jgi:tetratricopeptide (TPR) repeat protein
LQNKALWRFFYNPLIGKAIIGIIQKLMNNAGLAFIFGVLFLPGFSIASAQDKDDLEKNLTDYIALSEKLPESESADRLLSFISDQGDYVPQGFTARLEQIRKKKPDTVFVRYQLGLIYAEDITKYDKAVAEFKQGIGICRQKGGGHYSRYIVFFNFRLASLWLVNGRYREAFDLLEPLKKEFDFPYRAQVYNKFGVACYYQDRLYEAVDNFKTALIIDSKYAEAKFNLKSLNLKLEHFNQRSPNFVMARHFLGLSYAYQNKWDKAIEEYKRVMTLFPHYRQIHEVHNLSGSAHINLAGSIDGKKEFKNDLFKKGILDLKVALNLKPEFTEAGENLKNAYQILDLVDVMGISRLEAGNEYLNVELFSKALKEYDDVLENDPQNMPAQRKKVAAAVGWARVASCQRMNYDEAIVVCKKFLSDLSDKKAKNTLTLFLGYAYMQKGDQWYDKAVDELKKIPAIPQANYYLGLIYFNQGRLNNAMDQFQQAKRSDLDNPEYFFMLAKLQFYLKNYELAKKLFQKAVEKIGLKIGQAGSDSFKSNTLCRRRDFYEHDLAFVQKERGKTGILPSDRESIGLLISSESMDTKKGIYRYIKRYLEKQAGITVIDYIKYADLITEKSIPENCVEKACLDEYGWLTDTAKLLLLELDQWGDRRLVSFSMYHPKTNHKQSISERESQGVELYESVKRSLKEVTGFFKTQRVEIYCELCPQI